MAYKRPSFSFSKIGSVEKIDLDSSKKFFSAHTCLAFGFLTPQEKYPRLRNLGTRNLLNTQKAPPFFSLYLDRIRNFLNCQILS